MNIYNYKIVRERSSTYFDGRKAFSNPKIAASIMQDFYEENYEMDKENFTVAYLDSKNKILGINLVSIGTINSSLVHPREVFKGAILASANTIMLFHNHPSGDVKPSQEDIMITKRLKEVGEIIGIKVLDHIIISDSSENYVSLREKMII